MLARIPARREALTIVKPDTFIRWQRQGFRLYERTIRAPQIVRLLAHLGRHLRGKLILVWDRLPAHHSRQGQEHLVQHRRIEQEWLPAYTPQFNPVEYLWERLKEYQLDNLCLQPLAQPKGAARNARGRLQRRPAIVACCGKQAELPL